MVDDGRMMMGNDDQIAITAGLDCLVSLTKWLNHHY